MTALSVVQAEDGTWRVVRPNGKVVAEGLTYSRAWALWDRHDREAACGKTSNTTVSTTVALELGQQSMRGL